MSLNKSIKTQYTKLEALRHIKSLNLDLTKNHYIQSVLQETTIDKPTGEIETKSYLWGLIKLKTPITFSQDGYFMTITSCPINTILTFEIYKECHDTGQYHLHTNNEYGNIQHYMFLHQDLNRV